jgi:NTP pyrophosphatase (non-canonical NTP hydrolase)
MTATPTPVAGVAGDLPAHAAAIAECLRCNGFVPEQAVIRQVLGLAEETGEFVGAYRRWSGQARRTGTAEQMHEELADVIITAFVTAYELGVDINAVIAAKLRIIHTRGWREDPATPAPYRHSNGQPCHGCQSCLADAFDNDGEAEL